MELKPNEVVFLDYINGLDENVYIPDYWKFNCGIDANKIVKKLLDLGYLKFENNITENVFRATIPELKEILKNNNLKVTGKKQELAERVLGNIDVEYLKSKLPKKLFLLTPKGESVINSNYLYIINKKKNYMFTDKEIENAYKLGPEYSNNDRLWNIFTNRNIYFSSHNKWSSYRSNLFYMGQLLFDENRYEQALEYYIAVFILDLSGIEENNYVQDVDSVFVAPGIIKPIKSLISLCEFNLEDIKSIIDKNTFCNSIPFKYYSNDTLFKILTDCLNDVEFNFKKYPHNKPSKNNSKYTYYGFYEDNSFDVSIIEEKTNDTKTQKQDKKGLLSTLISLFK